MFFARGIASAKKQPTMDETGNRKRKREEQKETGDCASSKDSAADDGKDAAGYIHEEKK